jgi:hypothetical protein
MAKPSRQDTQVDSLALVTDRLRLLATRSSEMWWEIGQALDEVATRMLSQNLGYPDYAAYAHEVLGIDAAQARRIRRVAHHFSREVALRFGAERLDLLLDYLEASPDTHWAIDPLRVELYCTADAGRSRIAFAEATVDDVRRAVRSARRGRASHDKRFPADVASVRDRLAKALAALGKQAPQAKIHRDVGRPEEYSLAVVGVDPSNMARLGHVLVQLGKTLAAADKARKRPAAASHKRGLGQPGRKPASKPSRRAKAVKTP